ncbi:MAG: hypothetical protein WCZ89_02275 [Phycisphaerae bacterium]
MWVHIKKGFSGSVGGQYLVLASGQKYDLPADIIKALRSDKLLGRKNVVDTIPPWEEKVDQKAVEQNQKTADANSAIKKAEQLEEHCSQLEAAIGAGELELKKLLPELENAHKTARQLAKEAGLEWPPKAKPKNAGQSEG